jgi:WD40 repeat protein
MRSASVLRECEGRHSQCVWILIISSKDLYPVLRERDRGHPRSVTFKVSGSYDKTIRMWDTDSCDVAWGPFEGHTDWVASVAFSQDGSVRTLDSTICGILRKVMFSSIHNSRSSDNIQVICSDSRDDLRMETQLFVTIHELGCGGLTMLL